MSRGVPLCHEESHFVTKTREGIMNRLECKPFGKEHVEVVKKIALANYREER